MKIGIIGSGNIGEGAARLFAAAGHEVAVGNSRGPDSLKELVTGLGPNGHAETAEGAARFGEVVLVAIPFGRYTSLPADALAGRIVVDAMNYSPERDGQMVDLDSDRTTSSELLAAHLPGARVVKAFNTVWFKHLNSQGDAGKPVEERRAVPVAGDDDGAKAAVAALIDQVGFGPVDNGGLADGGRRQQPGTPVYGLDAPAVEVRRLLHPS